MKTSSVSSAAVSNAMRYQLMRMQADLTKAQKEATTLRVADVGLALGARTGQSVSFNRDVDRLKGITDSNALASSRLSSTQDALKQLSTAAQTFLSTLTTGISGDADSSVTKTDAKATLDALMSILNSSLNGEHLFAGTNTDVQPINDFSSAGSPNKVAFDASFLANFGFAQTDPAAANITEADMTTFLNTLEPSFLGAGWQGTWSNATDQRIVSRIALNETAETSVSANNEGIRKIAMAAATISDLFTGDMSDGAKLALTKKAHSLVGEALGDIANLQSETGIAQKRVTNATERLTMQVDLFKRNILELEGIDPSEAATRVSSLLSQIETSYLLTSRIQQLSLAKYLT